MARVSLLACSQSGKPYRNIAAAKTIVEAIPAVNRRTLRFM